MFPHQIPHGFLQAIDRQLALTSVTAFGLSAKRGREMGKNSKKKEGRKGALAAALSVMRKAKRHGQALEQGFVIVLVAVRPTQAGVQAG